MAIDAFTESLLRARCARSGTLAPDLGGAAAEFQRF
jgi:hypothetical protein